jgi:CxxC motif-containing protein (DUF1111 family)
MSSVPRTLLAVLLMLAPAPSQTADLQLTVTGDGQLSSVTVLPGAAFTWTVSAQLTAGDHDGLALLGFDLWFEGGTLEPAAPPTGDARLLGGPRSFMNPAGFGGTPMGDRLLQVGGGQDTLVPDDIRAGLAAPGEPLIVTTGRAHAPATPGLYRLQVEHGFANVLLPPDTTSGLRLVMPARITRSAPLVIRVTANGASGDTDAVVNPGWTPRPAELPLPSHQPRAGEPLANLTDAETKLFFAGRRLFEREFTETEGLGPLFNDDSCDACHREPASGGAHHRTVTRFGRRGPPFDGLEWLGGTVLQFQNTHPAAIEFLPMESDVQTLRLTPPLFGLGLVEQIPDAELIALEEEQRPGVGGRAHRVRTLEDGTPRVGRFGWKAQLATLFDFTGDALFQEMGITNRLFMEENAPNGDRAKLLRCDFVPDPEDHPDETGRDALDRLTDFQLMLGPPPQTPADGMSGERVFEASGCAACHRARFTTPPSDTPALSQVSLKPYSDFLVHDMGALGDGIRQGDASELEMRTAPLWGLVIRDAFLHDGTSSNQGFDADIRDAIGRHDGQAASSRELFLSLPAEEVEQLLAFLRSLGRPEFDVNGDNALDLEDAQALRTILTGPGAAFTPDDERAYADVDRDGDVDLADVAVFQRAATGSHPWTVSPNSTLATAPAKPGRPFDR